MVDLEWEGGSASRKWGYRHEDRATSSLLTAFEKGVPRRLLRGFNKPDLVPGHPDLEVTQPSRDDTADALLKWAGEWGRDWVVIDTHTGATEVVNLYSGVGPFSADSARIPGVVASVAGLVLAAEGRSAAAAATAVRLHQALASRAVINQAQGILMAKLSCAREEAFTRLVELAQLQGVRIRDAAQTVVDQTGRPDAGG